MTLPPDGESLMAAIRAEPAENTVRLVFADWLTENAGTVPCGACKGEVRVGRGNNGNPYRATCDGCRGSCVVPHGREAWAEFIRTQIGLAKWNPRGCNQGTCRTGGNDRPCTACREWEEMQARERILWPIVRPLFEGVGFRPICDKLHYVATEDVQKPIAYIRRGFPAVVRCSLAAWRGGDCEWCGGRGFARRPSGSGDSDCSDCERSGRTAGIGPALVAAWPVERVEITDAVIHPSGGNMTYYLGGLGVFPKEHWRQLAELPSQRAVRDALSKVCIREAREIAARTRLETIADK